jgi:hypothetical protein
LDAVGIVLAEFTDTQGHVQGWVKRYRCDHCSILDRDIMNDVPR